RVPQRSVSARDQGPRPLPQRAGRIEVSLPGHPITRPHRPRPGTMDHTVEASAQRVRDHLRRPIPGRRRLLMETAGNTVSEIDPGQRTDGIARAPERPLMSMCGQVRVLGMLLYAVSNFAVAVR